MTPQNLGAQAANRMLPLFAQDLVDAFKEDGLAGATLALPAAVGIGVASFPPPLEEGVPRPPRTRQQKESFQRRLWEVLPPTQEEKDKFQRKMDREFGKRTGFFKRLFRGEDSGPTPQRPTLAPAEKIRRLRERKLQQAR